MDLQEEEVDMNQLRIKLLREHCDDEIKNRNATKVKFLISNIMRTGGMRTTRSPSTALLLWIPSISTGLIYIGLFRISTVKYLILHCK